MRWKEISSYVLAYALWIAAILLGLAFLLIGMNGIPQILAPFFSATAFNLPYMAGFINRIFLILAGVGILVIIVTVESYFRHGAQSSSLWQRAARVFGPLILLIFVADLAQVTFHGYPFGFNSRWLILAAELLSGVALTYLGFRKPLPRMPRRPDSSF